MYQPEALQDIVRFATRCLDEDEQLARGAGEGNWKLKRPDSYTPCRIDGDDMIIYDEGGHTREQAAHIVRHGPEDVLADIEAKRQLVTLHGNYYTDPCLQNPCLEPELYKPCLTLRLVATCYTRREGFQQAWHAFGSV